MTKQTQARNYVWNRGKTGQEIHGIKIETPHGFVFVANKDVFSLATQLADRLQEQRRREDITA